MTIVIAVNLFYATASAENKISGFASFVAGVVTSGDQVLADYPNTGVYDRDFSFSPESLIGLQLKTDVADKASFIVQAIGRQSSGEAQVDWAYLKYQYRSNLSLDLGRKSLPIYFYSDVFDVAYSYYWIRPPSDNYTWQISSYNGISVNYEPEFDEWDALFSLYIGREDSDENELLTYLANGLPVNETWKNIIGVVAEFSSDSFEIRAALMGSELDREISGVVTAQDVDQVFAGVSINYYIDNFSVLSEYNRYSRSADDIRVTTYMLSFAYRIDKIKPYITYSELKQDPVASGGDENHSTTSLGMRWDFEKKLALKIQYDVVRDKGVNTMILGDGDLLAVALDVVF